MIDRTPVDTEHELALHVQDLHKSFNETEVLCGIDMHARVGEVISVIGSSGSGKSTFLRCLNLLERPNRGTIWIAGESAPLAYGEKGAYIHDSRGLQRLRAKVGMVFQEFNLWPHRTIINNLTLAPIKVKGISRDEAIARAEKYLERTGILEKRDCYPAQLSGGQQQRAAIARALCMDPEIILFDEPTSSLDPELVGEVLKVMRSLAEEGRTMVVVTHEMAFARDVSSRVMFFRNGIVEEDGTPEDVFGNPRSEACRRFVNA